MRWRALRKATLSVLAGVQAAFVPAVDAETSSEDAVRVSTTPSMTRTYEGASVAIDPNDSGKVYLTAADLQDRTCHVFRSTDGGRTFSELKGPDFGVLTDCGLNRGGIPQNIRMRTAVDDEGVVYWVVAVADPAALGGRSVVLARSRNAGASWLTTTVTTAPIPARPEEAVANFVPDLYVDPFGQTPRKVWVSWRRSFTEASERPTEGWAAVSNDGGETFQGEVRALETDPGFDAPRVVMDDQGTAYWFQRERPPDAPEGEEAKPSPLVMARSEDGGRTWTKGDLGQADPVMEEPLAGVSSDGRVLYLAWADGRNGDLDVFFMRSNDGGRSWSTPMRVNDDRQGNRRSQKWPRMSVAPGGRIDIAWYDYRNDAKSVPDDDVEFFLGDVNDVYTSSSEDGGRTFSTNTRVTDRSVDRRIGTYNAQYSVEVPPGMGSGDDRAVVAWSDTRLGNANTSAQDIFATVLIMDGVSGRSVLLAAEVFLLAAGIALLLGAMILRRRSRRSSTSA